MTFMFMTILGTCITASSYTWMMMWVGLEINLLSLIPLFKDNYNKLSAEAAMKYFLAQAFASSIILWSMMTMSNDQLAEGPPYSSFTSTLIIIALMIKMAAAPFHFWFPEVMSGTSWSLALILMTWQKIAPMVMLMNNFIDPVILSLAIMVSSIFSGIQGMNQMNLKKIMAYSSINHTSWMIAAILTTTTSWLNYFILYTLLTAAIVLMMYVYNINSFEQLVYVLHNQKNLKVMFFASFLSLGGLPPFLGFFPKWMTAHLFIIQEFYLTGMILIMLTMITIYFYVRIVMATFSLKTDESLIIMFTSLNMIHITLNMISILGLLACHMPYMLL
uniref:NADH-ubiquinone oxidoreductase chain 2 n=1 Tax=Rhinostomus barbirostris TaxID=206507 RepID=A0A346RIC4_9CUCU|nr:NADH dehydrogenase subunit 2 [Rhinostomus barbirostris]